MSRRNPDERMTISSVVFSRTVTIGGEGLETWSLRSAATSRLHGKVSCVEDGDSLFFIYDAGPVYQETEVHKSQCFITRIPAEVDAAPAKGKAK